MTLVDAETGEIMPFADATLEECEAVIERGLSSFVEVGNALVAIREGHKYRKTHKTFEAYCDQRWGISRPRAYELIGAAEIVETLSGMPDTPLPSNARQAAALAPLKDDPAAMADAMRAAHAVADRKPTARDVADAVRDRKPLDRKTVTPNFKGSAQPPEPTAAKPAKTERRKPFADTLTSVGWDVRKAAERVVKLFDDDRFPQQMDEVAARMRSHLEFSIEVCQDLIDVINHQAKDK